MRFAVRLPLSWFPQLRDQRFPARRGLCLLSQTEPPARNGLSLARNGCPFRSLHSGVNVPGLLLHLLAGRFRCPFGSSAPPPPAGYPPPRPLPCLVPVAASTTRSPGGSPASTPLWDSYLPRDQSVRLASSPSGPPSGSARSPFAPRRLNTSELDLLASDHRSRSATSPEACCSSNLLEPSSI